MKYYAGIGSRKTPKLICEAMTMLAGVLDKAGYTLRSGHAPGADQAFELGATNKEIFLPWKEFEGSDSNFTEPTSEAINVCRKLFPHFPGVSHGTRMLLSRNMHQVLGPDIGVSPKSEFVICWTPDGKASGGTAYAIKAAKHFDIPVYNFFNIIDAIKLKVLIDDLILPSPNE